MKSGLTLKAPWAWLKPLRRDDRTPASRAPATPTPTPRTTAPQPATERGGDAPTLAKQLALVIDLDACVGCHACAVACKQWNSTGGELSPDPRAWDAEPGGVFLNRVQTWEAGHYPDTRVLHLPKSCLHCEEPPCVPVCPTGASYKRAEDGVVLVDADKCIGCQYCSWACPYGAREYDEGRGVMAKCTLCEDRVRDAALPPADRQPACVKACPTGARLFGDVKDPASAVSQAIAERGGVALMPEWGTRPANRYLMPRGMQVSEGEQP